MKILTTKQIEKIRKYPPDRFWKEGLNDLTIEVILESGKPWAFWEEGKSYIWRGKKGYWCISKSYLDERGYKL